MTDRSHRSDRPHVRDRADRVVTSSDITGDTGDQYDRPVEPTVRRSLTERVRAVGDVVGRRAVRPTTILVLPGLGTDDRTTLPLRWYLTRLGHRVAGWELGVHRLPVAPVVRAFVPKLESLARTAGEPVTLVGWSLGGVVAREAARARPDLVAHVITLGSPLQWAPRSGRAPIRVPVTSMYSKRDRVVHWESSIDRTTPGAVNIEVGSTHAGLGLDPAVWHAIAHVIDERAGPSSLGR